MYKSIVIAVTIKDGNIIIKFNLYVLYVYFVFRIKINKCP